MMETGDSAQYLKEFNRDLFTFHKDVEIVREWLKRQAHLPEVMDDKRIESFLMLNKCSIERAKCQIDGYYTLRSVFPQLREFDMESEAFRVAHQFGYQLILPKLLHGKHRIIILKVRDPSLIDLVDIAALQTIMCANIEIRYSEDNAFNDVVIIDLAGCSKSFLAKCLVYFPTFLQIFRGGYTHRLKSIYYLNTDKVPFFGSFITVVQSLIKAKIFDKLIFCDMERVLQDIPKDLLPRDFCRGTGPTLEELWKDMNKLHKKYESFLSQRKNKLVNESLRVELVNSESMGFYGNFKKIDID